jgi:IS1 family transposase
VKGFQAGSFDYPLGSQFHHGHVSSSVLAYVFGRRQDDVFLRLKALLEPFGITRYYTDGWGTYERHVDAKKHTVGKEHMQRIESKHLVVLKKSADATPLKSLGFAIYSIE